MAGPVQWGFKAKPCSPAISHPLRKGGKFPHFRDFVSPAIGPSATSMSSQDSYVTDPSAQAAVSPWPPAVSLAASRWSHSPSPKSGFQR